MKTILYIGRYNGIIGGIERYMQKSASLLRKNGFAVHFLYMENGGQNQEEFQEEFDTVAGFSPENPLILSADLVVIHNIIPAVFLSALPENKTFFFAHDHNIYCERHHYYMPIGRINCHRKYMPLICKICSLCRNTAPPLKAYRKIPSLVLSDFMKENLEKNGFENVRKLPAFIQAEEVKRKIMSDGVLRILFLGQLIRGKGADLMLETLAKLDLPFHCTIAGEGKDRKMLEKLLEKFKLQDKVHFTGFVSKPEELWKNCDIFFFPIRWQEPFGLVALEAMAHGVGVMAFDLGGVREYLNEKTGILIPEKDTEEAAEKLKQLYLQPEKMRELGKNAFAWVRKNFTESLFVEKMRELCEEKK